ncbi:MAG: hypothetical protein WCR07_05685 [Verrucomicrobiota bacterium]|jgi:hypothetical protein
MARLTRQEQAALWIVLLLLAGGAAGRWWIHHARGASDPAPVPAARRGPAPDAAGAPGR